ncbi:hypothetical protein ZWY2020_005685 [Hordeum vulgare]|nr:hypothetical protein ZWY2020_005685 [Hordeum vulgare]
MSVGRNPEQAQNAVALLVWRDQGTIAAIHHVPGLDAGAVVIVARRPTPSSSACATRRKLLFNDRLNVLLRRSETGLVGNLPELMAPYCPLPVAVPEDCRSMFITFSKDMHLHREEIFDYFREKWGDCVVRVLMEKTTRGNMPMYGRIIFKTEAIVKLVLNGERLVRISIDHREMWLRKYIPRVTNATA